METQITEGKYTFKITEDLHSPDIKPFYLGSVTLAGAGNTRVSYRVHPDESEGRILDVIVKADLRGRDVGRKLVEMAERRFRYHGITKVVGYADPEVHGFWRKLGYQILPNNDIQKLL